MSGLFFAVQFCLVQAANPSWEGVEKSTTCLKTDPAAFAGQTFEAFKIACESTTDAQGSKCYATGDPSAPLSADYSQVYCASRKTTFVPDGNSCIFPFGNIAWYNECSTFTNGFDHETAPYCATALKPDGQYKTYGYCDSGQHGYIFRQDDLDEIFGGQIAYWQHQDVGDCKRAFTTGLVCGKPCRLICGNGAEGQLDCSSRTPFGSGCGGAFRGFLNPDGSLSTYGIVIIVCCIVAFVLLAFFIWYCFCWPWKRPNRNLPHAPPYGFHFREAELTESQGSGGLMSKPQGELRSAESPAGGLDKSPRKKKKPLGDRSPASSSPRPAIDTSIPSLGKILKNQDAREAAYSGQSPGRRGLLASNLDVPGSPSSRMDKGERKRLPPGRSPAKKKLLAEFEAAE